MERGKERRREGGREEETKRVLGGFDSFWKGTSLFNRVHTRQGTSNSNPTTFSWTSLEPSHPPTNCGKLEACAPYVKGHKLGPWGSREEREEVLESPECLL